MKNNLIIALFLLKYNNPIVDLKLDPVTCHSGKAKNPMVDIKLNPVIVYKGKAKNPIVDIKLDPVTVYSGNAKNGVPHGLGKSVSVKKQLYYLGHWVNGKYHGIGQLTCLGYSEYNGEFRGGSKCGYGKLSFINQDVVSMEGVWNDNILTCTCGLIKYKDGSYYKGAIENFERTGYGEYYFSNGNIYRGNWLNNVQHGSGRFIVKDNMEFITFWENGIPHPPYKIKCPDGSSYYGVCNEFFMPHGYGIKKYADGSVYKGIWANGMRNGYGMHLYPSRFNDMELRYMTILENNIKIEHKCSDYYCGEWVDDKKNGVGRHYYSLGSFVLEYLWNDDVPLFVTRRYYY